MNLISLLDYDELANFSNNSLLKQPQNLQAYQVFDYPTLIIIEPNYRITKNSTKLIINKADMKITQRDFIEKLISEETNYIRKGQYSLFIGIIKISGFIFLLMADNVVHSAFLETHEIFQIHSLAFISLLDEKELKLKNEYNEIIETIQIIKHIFSLGFYFSFSYDLTLSKDKIHRNIIEHDPYFWWNKNLQQDLVEQKIDKLWIIPIIQGFFKKFTVFIMGKKLDFILISRKSCKMAGTRYNARGLDDDGNVANFVETEQILYYSLYCCSFILIRGSIPLFWEQKGFSAHLKITRSIEAAEPAFEKHLNDLEKDYKRVLFINLLSNEKNAEKMLTDAVESLIQLKDRKNLKYEFFDFHGVCKGQNFENVDILLDKLEKIIKNFKFFALKINPHKILMQQEGVLRINCLDCLDRTNQLMTKVAAYMTQIMMKHMNTNLTMALGADLHTLLDLPSIENKKFHPFIHHFKNVWADNGDSLSLHYSGTGSTISKITRTSKVGFLNMLDHGMKSIQRFYKNNFEDPFKQQGIDILLNHKIDNKLIIDNYDNELISFKEVKLFIMSYSLKNIVLKSINHEKIELIFDIDSEYLNSEIIIFCFQDINSQIINDIIHLLNKKMKNNNYFEITKFIFNNLMTIVFSTNEYISKFKKILNFNMSFNMLDINNTNNAIILKMEIEDSYFCIINCRFPNGNEEKLIRLDYLKKIEEQILKNLKEDIENLDYKFLIGNFGFSIIKDHEYIQNKLKDVLELIEIREKEKAENSLCFLTEFDETNELKSKNNILEKYREGRLNFLPTFPYEIEKNKLDLGKKDYDPKWSDRIFYWNADDCKIEQINYEINKCNISEHRAIFSTFKIRLKTINTNKKEKILKILHNYIDKTPKKEENYEINQV